MIRIGSNMHNELESVAADLRAAFASRDLTAFGRLLDENVRWVEIGTRLRRVTPAKTC
jgi:hypothetical protein